MLGLIESTQSEQGKIYKGVNPGPFLWLYKSEHVFQINTAKDGAKSLIFIPRSIELNQHERFFVDGVSEVVLSESNNSLGGWFIVGICLLFHVIDNSCQGKKRSIKHHN